ncbi:MAG: ATP-binding protein [Syntrophales bacterium]
MSPPKDFIKKAKYRASNMTVRTRLIVLTVLGLAVTMIIWGWIQLSVLNVILIEQQVKRLYDLAETVSTYYQHFPTGKGLSALDDALEDHIKSDDRLARIDLFSIVNGEVEYIVGAGRVPYEWSENIIGAAMEKSKTQRVELNTDGGPALGLLYPFLSERDTQVFVGVIVFSQTRFEILARAKRLLLFSTMGLLLAILLVLALSYRWLIGRPLGVIIDTIDEFRAGKYIKRIPIARLDEWGHLADHFNVMAEEIERVLARNQELQRHLEERVQEATHNVVQLQQQVNQLQQLTALGHLTATLAHDLGTPLHSIAGLAKLLLERDAWPPDVGRKLELIVQQTQRLNTVIQNVRHATRLPEPHFEAVSVPDLLNETLPLVEPLMQKSGIQLSVDMDEDIPILFVDRYRVQTAMFNLIQNALEAMSEGGKISITAKAVPQNNAVAITVHDNGPGIPPELLARVCEPFFSTHTDEGLRGLGLAIVQDIVKIHGGKIEMQSSSDEGTHIVLYFPIVENVMSVELPHDAPSLSKP